METGGLVLEGVVLLVVARPPHCGGGRAPSCLGASYLFDGGDLRVGRGEARVGTRERMSAQADDWCGRCCDGRARVCVRGASRASERAQTVQPRSVSPLARAREVWAGARLPRVRAVAAGTASPTRSAVAMALARPVDARADAPRCSPRSVGSQHQPSSLVSCRETCKAGAVACVVGEAGLVAVGVARGPCAGGLERSESASSRCGAVLTRSSRPPFSQPRTQRPALESVRQVGRQRTARRLPVVSPLPQVT